jgi:hypothetical protein
VKIYCFVFNLPHLRPRTERLICYLLTTCYLGMELVANAGDILRGNTTGNNPSAAKSTFFGVNQAAMNQLQKNANDILTRAVTAAPFSPGAPLR